MEKLTKNNEHGGLGYQMDFLALILVVIDDRRLSSIKTKMSRLLRLIFSTREAFFRLLVQRYKKVL